MHGLKKMIRDLWLSRGRAAMMVSAIAVSLTGLATVLGAYGILTREIRGNYIESVPASATFDIDGVSRELLEAVRRRPEVAAAERRRTLQARFRGMSESDWRRALLFVVDDFEEMTLAKIRRERGAWPPPLGTVLVERSALQIFGVDLGDGFWLKTPRGEPHRVTVSGVVHEPALAPAITEQSGYAYATAETFAWLGGKPVFDELRVLLADNTDDRQAIEQTAQTLAAWMEGQGYAVHLIKIPPPLEHPHESQMRAMLTLLAIFAVLVVLLSGILTAALVSTLMARQVREIGVMKTIGARTRQVALMYVTMIGSLALLALGIAWLPGLVAGRAFATAVARLLNFDIASSEVPLWVFGLQAVTGLGLPLLTALPTIWRGSRVTVREAISDYGVSRAEFGERGLDRLLARRGKRGRIYWFALRNTLRRRARFALTLGLLAAAGGFFVSAISISDAWDVTVGRVFEQRHYDLEVRFDRPELVQPLVERLETLPEVHRVEAWGLVPTAVSYPGRTDVIRTYPDGGHGSFNILAVPPDTGVVDFKVLSGRWLRADDTDAVVINQMVPGSVDLVGDPVGKSLTLTISDRPTRWRIVGVIEEVGNGAAAYVGSGTFNELAGTEGRASMLRVATSDEHDVIKTRSAIGPIEKTLESAGVGISFTLPLEMLQEAFGEHVVLLIQALLTMAILMAIVGALGLSSAMGTNVVERTRELGILQAIGASPAQVRRVVLLEGLFVGLLSIGGAVLLALPLALAIGDLVGRLSFRIPLPLQLSWSAVGLWTVGVILLSFVASLVPARRAGELTVREALAYV